MSDEERRTPRQVLVVVVRLVSQHRPSDPRIGEALSFFFLPSFPPSPCYPTDVSLSPVNMRGDAMALLAHVSHHCPGSMLWGDEGSCRGASRPSEEFASGSTDSFVRFFPIHPLVAVVKSH